MTAPASGAATVGGTDAAARGAAATTAGARR
jgi:hypothetical protein